MESALFLSQLKIFIGQQYNSIYIPKSVTSIGESAFCGIEYIDVDEDNPAYTYRDGCFLTKDLSTLLSMSPSWYSSGKLRIPDYVRNIETMDFNGLEYLSSVIFPDNLESVGPWAFASCTSLTSIVLPETMKNIKYGAFLLCTGLTAIYSYAAVPPTLEDYGFDENTCQNVTLYVPVGSAQAYRAAVNWSNFVNIVELDPTGIGSITADDNAAPATYYDLQGRRLNAPRPGVNIINGKKVVIK